MSKQGIRDFASCLGIMQEARIRLLDGDNQDILLGQLLDKAKDAVKDRFARITMESEVEDER